jgi:hypothetical protein
MAEGFDRLLGAVRDLVRQLTGHTDYHAAYLCEVVGQNADGTLELKPGSPKLPGFSKVPILGPPGVRFEVAKGARVLLGFWDGLPQHPFAALFAGDSLKSITIEASVKAIVKAPKVYVGDDASARPVAYMGALVKVTIPPPIGPFDFYGYITDGSQSVSVKP